MRPTHAPANLADRGVGEPPVELEKVEEGEKDGEERSGHAGVNFQHAAI